MTTLTHLECSLCSRTFEASQIRSLCECGGVLLARYDLENARLGWSREWLGNSPTSMWRYMPLLPVAEPASIVSLGEGMTPLVRARRLGEALGTANLWIKDEGVNPTGSCEARSFSCAVSLAMAMGTRRIAIASGADAAAACAAYAAAAGIQAEVSLPDDAPQANFLTCMASGAQTTLAGEARLGTDASWEFCRIEGKKTVGFELAEQLRWELPDAIICPTGSGAALIGMWKAFEELEAIGWVTGQRPKMIAVQAQGCRPVVEAFSRGEDRCRTWENGFTLAGGLRVRKPLGDALILKILRQSEGAAVAVSDQEMLDAGIELASAEGIFAAPEGAACLPALRKLLGEGLLRPDERIVICNPVSGLKYSEAYATRFPRFASTERDKLGGLITPR